MRKMYTMLFMAALALGIEGNVANAQEVSADVSQPHFGKIQYGDEFYYTTPLRLGFFAKNGDESYFFDEVQYVQSYPELTEIYGLDKKALWNHYKTVGIYEGKIATSKNKTVQAQLKIADVSSTIITPDMSDYEKCVAVHDWIINHTRFDIENAKACTVPKSDYTMEGTINNGTGVCGGYAAAFDCFMDLNNVPCEFVVGEANGRCHGWNQVLIDGQYYYIDVTFDDPVSPDGKNLITHNYCMISVEQMERDHITTQFYDSGIITYDKDIEGRL